MNMGEGCLTPKMVVLNTSLFTFAVEVYERSYLEAAVICIYEHAGDGGVSIKAFAVGTIGRVRPHTTLSHSGRSVAARGWMKYQMWCVGDGSRYQTTKGQRMGQNSTGREVGELDEEWAENGSALRLRPCLVVYAEV